MAGASEDPPAAEEDELAALAAGADDEDEEEEEDASSAGLGEALAVPLRMLSRMRGTNLISLVLSSLDQTVTNLAMKLSISSVEVM